jgi:hypothetical protein
MRTSRSARLVGLVLASCLVTGGLAREARAAKGGSFVSARIGGKRFRSTSPRLTFGQYGNLTLLLFGSTAGRAARRVRSVGFGCVPIDLTAVTLPFTCDGNGNYQDVRIGRRASAKAWGTISGLRVTIEGYDGGRIRGVFSGAFDFGNENGATPLPPITVEEGRFDLKLR